MGARFTYGSFGPVPPHCASENSISLCTGTDTTLGSSPCRRSSQHAKWRLENLRDHGAYDRCNPALAIEHRCARGAVVYRKAIISLVHLQERCACEPAVDRILHEPTTHKAWVLIWVGERYETIFRLKWRRPNGNAPGSGKGRLQFKRNQFFRAAADPAPDPRRYYLAVGPVLNIEGLPVLGRESHRSGDVPDSDNIGRRLEPRGAMYADHVGLGAPLRLFEISRDAYGRMRQLCKIDTACIGAGLRRK